MKIPQSPLQAPPQQKTPEEKLREVSKEYEKHFLGEMMKAMRSTVHESGFIQTNQAEKIFREQLDQEYVDKWGAQGGIGLSDLIYQQLVDKYGAQMGLKIPEMKPQGPIPLTQKDSFTAKSFNQNAKSNQLNLRFDRNLNGATLDANKPIEIQSPWAGLLTGKKSLGGEENIIEINHENGLKSHLVFRGTSSALRPGQQVQAGETLGLLSPEAKSFFWQTQSRPQEPTSVGE